MSCRRLNSLCKSWYDYNLGQVQRLRNNAEKLLDKENARVYMTRRKYADRKTVRA